METDSCTFYFEDANANRKKLFAKALLHAKDGKVLYILAEELNELPVLSQDLSSINKHYMKMVTFMYVKSLDSLIESISALQDWQSIPSTIILDDLSAYCNKNDLQNACGIVALLQDSTKCCSNLLKGTCRLFISVPKGIVGEDYCNMLKELYC
ncbi:hypothetical protein PYW08_004415 [Mythimna loreyi]|uniref:Uncharacterized protein n=1 Tax=Mythimna loreyi TaxID=667449 RepID=A0ACC2QSZ0_9NEOP|nr:hypothetical protein PYW08_004415 [Mythimna loreyi]